ncbi:MAG: hypothetical protein IT337_04885 [Thermomicrobiales bacterium]|nr:hypothetical protein [Thermomicrobiales bacterium]
MATLTPPPDPSSPRRSRLEDEVIEILNKTDRPPTVVDRAKARAAESQATLLREFRRPSTLQRPPLAMLAVSLVLAIAAALVSGIAPFLGILLGLASFAALASLWFQRTPAASSPPRWRGRDMGGRPKPAEWLERWRTPPKP